MSIVYACIVRHEVILASHQLIKGDYDEHVFEALRKMQPNEKETSLKSERVPHVFHILFSRDFLYGCAADVQLQKHFCFNFLKKLEIAFQKSPFGKVRAKPPLFYQMNKEFRKDIISLMSEEPKPESGQIGVLQTQVDEVKRVMTDNIEKILERDEKLDDLLIKAADLQDTASTFKSSASKVRRNRWFKNVRLWIIVAAVGVIVLTAIILFAAGVI